MTFSGWLTIILFVAILTALALGLGSYMAKVYSGERVFLTPIFAWPELVRTTSKRRSPIRRTSGTSSPLAARRWAATPRR